MIKRYAVIRDGVVEQITLWDAEKAPKWKPPAGTSVVSCAETVYLGDLYAKGQFAHPIVSAKAASEIIEVVGQDNLTDSERATFKALAAKVAG